MTHFRERCEQICRRLAEAQIMAAEFRRRYPDRRVWVAAFENAWMVMSAPKEEKQSGNSTRERAEPVRVKV